MELQDNMVYTAMQRLVVLYYQKILYADLTDDFYTVLKVGDEEWALKSKQTSSTYISEWFSWFAESDFCFEEDREAFKENTKLDKLKETFKLNGNKPIRICYRRKNSLEEKEYHSVAMEMIPDTDKNGHQILFIFVREMEKEEKVEAVKVEQIEEKRHLMDHTVTTNKRKILVVEDNEISRAMLRQFLSADYEILEAVNGEIGLAMLRECYRDLSLVILDVYMPVIDGFEFLKYVRQDAILSSVPIVVTTGSDCKEDEAKCLEFGAADFITKPYNGEVVRKRIRSLIHLKESSTVISELQFDDLTSLYTKQAFYHHCESLIRKHPDEPMCLVMSDIANFKLVNERFGEEMGDEVLRQLASTMKRDAENTVLGRINGDVFASFAIGAQVDRDILMQNSQRCIKSLPVANLTIKYGVYEDVDRTMAISAMCDRAMMALRSTKNHYGYDVAYYDNDMSHKLMKEQQILDCMEKALEDRQFIVYYQPKHDIKTGKIVGAEALVRWIHPQYGFMSPGDFVPIFERNGFIYNVDYYVWSRTCCNIENWLAEGIQPVPISVNSSRIDLFREDYFSNLMIPVEEHKVPRQYLHVEVTESLCMDNPDEMIKIISKVREMGFLVEMDDFGSGYSSLNMLSSIPIDILKLDMKFMGDLEDKKKRSILECCINLAQKLDYRVVAEGVETKDQIDVLANMGCGCVQGYYFAKPMPEDEFKEYLKKYI